MALALVFGLFSAGATLAERLDGADTGGRPFSVTLTGAAEAPGPGDPDGTGTALLTLNPGQGVVCYEFNVEGVDPITAAHIHQAPVGSPGPVVVPLMPAEPSLSWSGCTENVDQDLIKDILKNPEAYYVNVHNPAFQPGALRAQLG
jgi:hypothetical protein